MRRNLKEVRDYTECTTPLYFPDEFKSHFRMTRQAVHPRGHAHISCSLRVFRTT